MKQVNITESGDVCLEFVKNKGKEERVVEVFTISSDGLQVGLLLFSVTARVIFIVLSSFLQFL